MTTMTAQKYKDSLPVYQIRQGKPIYKWTLKTYAIYVNLLYPHITVPLDQEWVDNKSYIIHVCEKHGEYKASPNNVLKLHTGCRCDGCKSEKQSASAGTLRTPRATQAEKIKAAELRTEGKSYSEIGRILGRSNGTIIRWLDPEYAERSRQFSAKWRSENREQHNANGRRYRSEFQHGKATRMKAQQKRRAIEYHCADTVFLPNHPDADHQGFVYYDMWSDYVKGDSEAMSLFSFTGADEAVAFRKMQLEKFKKFSGIDWSLDHLVPLSRGGIHHPMNFVNLPLADNKAKNNKLIQKDVELFCKRLFDIK